MVDIGARDAILERQWIAARNNHHQLFGRVDYAANGVDAEFVNDPVDRGPELDPSQLILSCNFSFLQLGDAALNLAQLLLRVGEPVLIDGDRLQSRFRDLAAEFGDLS